MTWRPLSRIPNVVELALLDAVRASVSGLDTHAGFRREENGALAVDLADGRRLLANFRTLAQRPATFGAREALRHDLEGRAVMGAESLGLAAHAVVDVKTRAFLDVGCEIRWRDVSRHDP
ncbi:MAG: hypothetical protein JO234_12395 [Hyphomicrobiales bacterium]|nr:hypothetical protein [Hyphomicrobiales bacterium]